MKRWSLTTVTRSRSSFIAASGICLWVQLLASPQQAALMKRRRGVMMNTFFTLFYHKSLFSLFLLVETT
jgi:hypothetical protein